MGEHDGEGPLHPLDQVLRRLSHRILRPHVHRPALSRAIVESREAAAVAAGKEDVRVLRAVGDVAALATAGREVEGTRSPALPREVRPSAAGNARRRVVLLCAADEVGLVVRGHDAVELRGGVVLLGPGLPAVERHVGAAVVRIDHPIRLVWRDPQVVVVAVRHADRPKRLPAVARPIEAGVERVDDVGILRIGIDPRVVERPLPESALLVDPGPGRAAIIRAEHAAAVVLHDGVDAPRRGRRDRDADLATYSFLGQSLVARDLGPGFPEIGALEEPAAGAARRHAPRLAPRLPQRGVHHGGVAGVHCEIHRAGPLVAIEHLAPCLATVGGLVHAALSVRGRVHPERRDPDGVAVGRVHADSGNVLRRREPHVSPGLAAVGGLVDAVALLDVAAELGLARPDVDHVRVGLADLDGADRRGVDLAVRHRLPGRAAVGRLPQPAAGRAEVVLQRPGGAAGHRRRATAAVGSDAPPSQGVVQGLVILLRPKACGHGRERRGEHAHDGDGAGERG